MGHRVLGWECVCVCVGGGDGAQSVTSVCMLREWNLGPYELWVRLRVGLFQKGEEWRGYMTMWVCSYLVFGGIIRLMCVFVMLTPPPPPQVPHTPVCVCVCMWFSTGIVYGFVLVFSSCLKVMPDIHFEINDRSFVLVDQLKFRDVPLVEFMYLVLTCARWELLPATHIVVVFVWCRSSAN